MKYITAVTLRELGYEKARANELMVMFKKSGIDSIKRKAVFTQGNKHGSTSTVHKVIVHYKRVDVLNTLSDKILYDRKRDMWKELYNKIKEYNG